jgi:hypothetical protein
MPPTAGRRYPRKRGSPASLDVSLDAADANDDGAINIADAIAVLSNLFANAGPLPAPFNGCGTDPTIDELGCLGYAPCQ